MKRITAFALLALACTDAMATGVRCHVIYGGENFTVDATPTSDPYRGENVKIGRYFEFKLVYAKLPVTGESIKAYVYGVSTGTPVPIHQATWYPPFDTRSETYGFTGFHSVYEPSKSSEIQYWCQYFAGEMPAQPAAATPTGQLTPVPPKPQ
ncbi:hypothetical protein FNZ56_12435 [Pseudoluteimonas lycopersici]|uniref:Uncharacterized protein n=1 Tax=Pseudoluteimonas lycopersici TaxID=1324796 RepID=A0A516V7X9_9GAMM|nr:hypothetical protein [Lysobacter lycopersici]QDQ74633.1 hypothetical protein FNZ56_12435 [Lysobacter lycopersici]